jgi:uncharacterized protein
MLLVKTQLGLSDIHGIGLFADQLIRKGTVTWQYHPDFDAAYKEEDMLKMSDAARDQFLKYAYYDKDLDLYILCSDDQRFINHNSEYPNIISTPRRDVAAHDILCGEELLCNYNCYDDTYFIRVGMPQLAKTAVALKQSADIYPASLSAPTRF